jgi:hypothetical protein
MNTKAHYKIRVRELIEKFRKPVTLSETDDRVIQIARGNSDIQIVFGIELNIGKDNIYDLNGDLISDEEKDNLINELKTIVDDHNIKYPLPEEKKGVVGTIKSWFSGS